MLDCVRSDILLQGRNLTLMDLMLVFLPMQLEDGAQWSSGCSVPAL